MGILPEYDLTNTLWYKVAVDLIGPWSAKTENFSSEFFVLTCIYTTTNLVELICIDTKSSDAIARKFKQPDWLVIPEQCASSTIIEASLQDMPLPICCAS